MTVQELIEELKQYPPDMLLVNEPGEHYRGGDYAMFHGVRDVIRVHPTTYGHGYGFDGGESQEGSEFDAGPAFDALLMDS